MKTRFPYRSLGRQDGVTMIEAMVALLVMSFGMVALVGLLSNLRQNADIARQRGDAMRIARAEVAKLRSFSVVDKGTNAGVLDYVHDSLAPVDAEPAALDNSNTTFAVTRSVSPISNVDGSVEGASVAVIVKWKNRYGADELLRLDTVLAKVDPAFSTALAIAPLVDGVRTPLARNPVIPNESSDVGNGSSVFRPKADANVVWVFNNASGVITGRCQVDPSIAVTALTPRDLESCDNSSIGYLVAGTIQFSGSNPANPTVPNGVARTVSAYVSLIPSQYMARDSRGAMSLVEGGAYPAQPSPACFISSPATTATSQTFVNYNCLVLPNTQRTPNWWGQVLLGDLDIGTASNQFKVCRYSADYNGNGYTYQVLNASEGTFKIDNEEHPDIYRGVSYSLAKQNFLVVRGDVACPTAPAVDVANGVFVDYSTVQIQPAVQ